MSPLLPQPTAAPESHMQGSLAHIVWTICYLSVLIGLSAYGIHRYFIIYLFLKNRKREAIPARRFEQLPKVTMQLPIFNEVYVVERLLRSVSELDYPRQLLQIQVLDDSTDDTRELTSSCADELRRRGFNVQLIHRVDVARIHLGVEPPDEPFVLLSTHARLSVACRRSLLRITVGGKITSVLGESHGPSPTDSAGGRV